MSLDQSMNAAILAAAEGYLGVKEIPGALSNPKIEEFHRAATGNAWTDDVPWCASFVGFILGQVGIQGTGSAMARSYLTWGRKVELVEAAAGDIVVLRRKAPAPAGHVCILTDIREGKIHGIGGNQSDAVTHAAFPLSDVLGIRRADLAAQATGRPTIKTGAQGAFVLDLQDQLIRLGYFAGKRDGDFGSRTRAAVLAFQADAGLATDGVVGPRTWAALEKAPPRAGRDVSEATLRREGSSTIAAADRVEVLTGLGGATAVITATRQAAEEAQGLIPTARALVVDNWPLLIVGGLVLAAVVYARRIKATRVEDARSGAHVGR